VLVSLWWDGLRSALDLALLFGGVVLVWLDVIITTRGLRRGVGERNPVLRSFIKTFGMMGLMATGILASTLLLVLFALLNEVEWLILSVPFLWIMGFVVLMNLRRIA
jgi:hypothetical protein